MTARDVVALVNGTVVRRLFAIVNPVSGKKQGAVLWRNRVILKKPPHLRSVEEKRTVAPAVVGWVECWRV